VLAVPVMIAAVIVGLLSALTQAMVSARRARRVSWRSEPQPTPDSPSPTLRAALPATRHVHT
jgi:hypothetical protein